MPVIHGSFHSFAHSSEHGIHYDDPSHSSETKPGGGGEGGHIPLKVTPEQNSFTPAASGLPPDSTPRKSTLQKVTSPTKQGDYVVDTKAPADANGSRPVYRRENDDIGTLKPTQERAIPDGKGGWKMVSDADAAKPASHPALPPAAKIDPKQLGPLNDKGVYPGGDGNSYVRVGDDHYRVNYDQSLKGWMVVDPNRPHDFSRSVPVKLDGKGGVEKVLPKPELRGGIHPRIGERMKAEEDVKQKEKRADSAKAEWEKAEANYKSDQEEHARAKAELEQHSKNYNYMESEYKLAHDKNSELGELATPQNKATEAYFQGQKNHLGEVVRKDQEKESSWDSKVKDARTEADKKKKNYEQAQSELSDAQKKLRDVQERR